MNDFERLIEFLTQLKFGEIIVMLFELIAITTGLILVRKDKNVIYFLIYLTLDFILTLVYCYANAPTIRHTNQLPFFNGYLNVLVSVIELTVYYLFFLVIIRNATIIRLMKLFSIVFIAVTVTYIVTQFKFLTNRPYHVSNIIGAIEFLFLLLPCFVYFYELLKNDPIIKLFQRPSFWIVTGIFFYSLISIPYYLIGRFISDNLHEYKGLLDLAFFYIPFNINCIFLTRAFLCKTTLAI